MTDDAYNVVAYNQTAKELYPQLEVGKKCYQCLMDADAPCGICPILNKVKGPKTYFDPIRKLYEVVDVLDIPFQDQCYHTVVLSTTGEREDISKQLPTNETELMQLLEQEYYDKLTGGFTRKGFIRAAEEILKQAKDRADYGIIMFDLHNFKAINEIFGVDGGDRILKYIYSNITKSQLTPEVSSRLESDWFVCLVKKENLHLEELNSLMNREWEYEGRTVHLHLRCGIYYIDHAEVSVSNMIEWAIMAKQSADQEGIRSYAVFDASMRTNYIGRAEIVSNFHASIRNHDFKVYYQPVIRLSTHTIYAAEALVRWHHPTLGFVPPDRFIEILEKNGLITQLDHYVMKDVYRFLKALPWEMRDKIRISLNLSWQDFYDHKMMDDIITYSEDMSISKGSINYEVTETSIAALEQNCAYLLEQIRQSGAKLLLDDFGSGYSSLSMIGSYSFDIIKIDRSFISEIEQNPKICAVIRSVIEMCHTIGLRVIAEGVENEAQLRFLKEQNCDFVQGYYFAKPMPESEFVEYLQHFHYKTQIAHKDMPEVVSRPVVPLLENDEVTKENLMDLLDHSGQFIQVCHPEDYSMVYANEMTRMISGHPKIDYRGKKCYQYMLGLDAPCGHCPMKQMGQESEKAIEVDDGEHVFALTARYTTWNGRRVFIEFGRDITPTKIAQRRYTEHIKSILEMIPDGQGVFHVDLTADSWVSSGGKAQNARNMQNVQNVDTLIRMIGSFVPQKEGQELFFKTFCRKALFDTYNHGRYQVVLETESYYDDKQIRWSRITAHLIENPDNGHLECIIYGVDISQEKARIEELEAERKRARETKEELQKEVKEAMDLYSKADHDRRFDFLTGLKNRLDLFELLKTSAVGKKKIRTVFMIDIDDFKRINDSYGHEVGDKCLSSLGEALEHYGLTNRILFYRYGGEEILGIDFEQRKNPKLASQELLQLIRDLSVSLETDEKIRFTASIGYTGQCSDHEQMIDLADKAMYLAKKYGKDRAVCFEDV